MEAATLQSEGAATLHHDEALTPHREGVATLRIEESWWVCTCARVALARYQRPVPHTLNHALEPENGLQYPFTSRQLK